MGVSNEFSSETHRSRHRHDCQSHRSVARIGPTTRAGQDSAAIRPEIAATETAEWERRYPAVSSEIDSRIGCPSTGRARVKLDSANKTRGVSRRGIAKLAYQAAPASVCLHRARQEQWQLDRSPCLTLPVNPIRSLPSFKRSAENYRRAFLRRELRTTI
jgi:hypothetical protein